MDTCVLIVVMTWLRQEANNVDVKNVKKCIAQNIIGKSKENRG